MKRSLIDSLAHITKRKNRLIVGVLSGTSIDSVHAALCKISGSGIGPKGAVLSLEAFSELPYPENLRKKLRVPHELKAREIAELNVQIADLFARAVKKVIKKAGLKAKDIDLVGSHGQTIYHHSRYKGALKTSLQIGCGDVIAERLQIPVVADFRAKDIAVGGEGAPLTPYADRVFFGTPQRGRLRIILNLGGIANITVLSSSHNKIIGFDTGPANAPLDRLARMISKGALSCDRDGRIAKKGKVSKKLLATLISEDKYHRTAPPKSSGFEMYGDSFVASAIKKNRGANADLMATLTEFSAVLIRDAVQRYVTKDFSSIEFVLAGGGAQNPALVEAIIRQVRPAAVFLSEHFGIPGCAREAMAFALFANELLFLTPSTLPSITGAKRPAVLGKLSMP